MDTGFMPVGLDMPYRVFISEDPIGLWGGINMFVYTDNDPLNWIDPDGLFYYKKNVPAVGSEMEDILKCMDKCLNSNLGVSGGSECKSPHKLSKTRGHCAGKAADLSYRMNPGLKQTKVLCCAKKCGAQYAKIEKTHIHVQTHTGRGTHGALPACDKECK
jgi:uncharacterized protein RhaS with RHS repeats